MGFSVVRPKRYTDMSDSEERDDPLAGLYEKAAENINKARGGTGGNQKATESNAPPDDVGETEMADNNENEKADTGDAYEQLAEEYPSLTEDEIEDIVENAAEGADGDSDVVAKAEALAEFRIRLKSDGGGGDGEDEDVPEAVKSFRERVDQKAGDWVPYEGPQGGEGWKNTDTGDITYDKEPPGGVADPDDISDEDLQALAEEQGVDAEPDEIRDAMEQELQGREEDDGADGGDMPDSAPDDMSDTEREEMAGALNDLPEDAPLQSVNDTLMAETGVDSDTARDMAEELTGDDNTFDGGQYDADDIEALAGATDSPDAADDSPDAGGGSGDAAAGAIAENAGDDLGNAWGSATMRPDSEMPEDPAEAAKDIMSENPSIASNYIPQDMMTGEAVDEYRGLDQDAAESDQTDEMMQALSDSLREAGVPEGMLQSQEGFDLAVQLEPDALDDARDAIGDGDGGDDGDGGGSVNSPSEAQEAMYEMSPEERDEAMSDVKDAIVENATMETLEAFDPNTAMELENMPHEVSDGEVRGLVRDSLNNPGRGEIIPENTVGSDMIMESLDDGGDEALGVVSEHSSGGDGGEAQDGGDGVSEDVSSVVDDADVLNPRAASQAEERISDLAEETDGDFTAEDVQSEISTLSIDADRREQLAEDAAERLGAGGGDGDGGGGDEKADDPTEKASDFIERQRNEGEEGN